MIGMFLSTEVWYSLELVWKLTILSSEHGKRFSQQNTYCTTHEGHVPETNISE
jgi:hypothetical protein